MRAIVSIALITLAALGAAPAQAHGHWRGGVSIGIGLPLYFGPQYGPWYGYPYGYYAPAPVVVAPPPPVVVADPPAVQPVPAKAAPDPIFYPRNGQSATQLEADRQACNRWATTQPAAMADASVFQRATLACMDGHGYSAR